MKTIFVDSNAFLRLYLGDQPRQAAQMERLFRQAAAGELLLQTNTLVVFECAFTLRSFYKKSWTAIVEFIQQLLETPGLDIESAGLIRQALELMEAHGLKYPDAFNAAWALAQGIETFVSFDRDFRKVKGLRLVP